jgi:hypothetical protein
MRTPPAFATWLLLRLGPPDESFAGDLAEEYAAGRSRSWYWRQALSAVVLTSIRHAGAHPVGTLGPVIAGWGAMLLLFFVLADGAAARLAGWLWGWEREAAYQTGVWWPFWIAAQAVSYTGFALSAVVVVGVSRRRAGPVLVIHAASMVVALLASAVTIEVLSRLWDGRVPVPHTLFYVVSVALPYHWYSGLLVGPSIILMAGLAQLHLTGVPGRSRASS